MRFIACALLLVITPFDNANTQSLRALSTWDDGTQGWYLGQDSTGEYHWQSSGGNPAGYVYFLDLAGSGQPPLLAPSEFLGDYSNFVPGARFEWDVKIESGTAADGILLFLIGPGGKAGTRHPVTPTLNWSHQTLDLDPGEWTMMSGSWEDLISSIDSIYINLDVVNGLGPDGAIDNFALWAEEIAAVPLLSYWGVVLSVITVLIIGAWSIWRKRSKVGHV